MLARGFSSLAVALPHVPLFCPTAAELTGPVPAKGSARRESVCLQQKDV